MRSSILRLHEERGFARYLHRRKPPVMDQSRSESRRQRKHPHLQVLEIENNDDAGVSQTGAMKEFLIGEFGQDELGGHHVAVDQLFTNVLENRFEEFMHCLVSARAQM